MCACYDLYLIYITEYGDDTADIRHCFTNEGFSKAGLHFSMLNPAAAEINRIKTVINKCFSCDYIVVNCDDKQKADSLASEIAHLYPEQDIILISNQSDFLIRFPNLVIFPNLTDFAQFIITKHTQTED